MLHIHCDQVLFKFCHSHFPQETLDSLSDLYVSLSEEDLWAGLWMERCRFSETAVAIAYETQGLFELAQESYEKVSMCWK